MCHDRITNDANLNTFSSCFSADKEQKRPSGFVLLCACACLQVSLRLIKVSPLFWLPLRKWMLTSHLWLKPIWDADSYRTSCIHSLCVLAMYASEEQDWYLWLIKLILQHIFFCRIPTEKRFQDSNLRQERIVEFYSVATRPLQQIGSPVYVFSKAAWI